MFYRGKKLRRPGLHNSFATGPVSGIRKGFTHFPQGFPHNYVNRNIAQKMPEPEEKAKQTAGLRGKRRPAARDDFYSQLWSKP